MDPAVTSMQAARAAVADATTGLVMRPVVGVSLGQMLMARVLEIRQGEVDLALAGRRITAQTQLPMLQGESVQLQVTSASDRQVGLRLMAPSPTAEGQSGTTAFPGIPPTTARALTAAVATLPTALRPAPGDLPALGQRAVAVGVQTPAQAAAFVRLAAAGLPTTPAAVAGLAQLIEGPPLGRSLADITAAARPPAPGGQPAPSFAAAPPPSGTPTPPGGNAPAALPGAPTGTAAPGAEARAPATAAPSPPGQTVVSGTPAGTPPAPPPGAPAAAKAIAPDAPAGTAVRAASAPPATLLALSDLVDTVAERAVRGDAHHLREAIRDLGHGLEQRLLARDQVDQTVRSLLLAVGRDPEVPAATARLADRTADAVAAQQLAPATVDPSANTAYLQIPLPGGQSAEIHVTRDGGDGHEDADRVSGTRIAFLLTMSSLGPLMVDATVADDGVEAVVRAHNAEVDAFLTERAGELADALGNALGIEGGARVQVRSGGAPAPSRLLAGPPSTGLDVQA